MASEQLAVLQQEVAENKTVMESAAALITGISEKLREHAGDKEAILALATELDTNSTALQNAVVANTPASEETA